MSVDLRKIKKLIELVEESGIAELEVRDGEESVRIARYVAPPASLPGAPVSHTAGAPEPAAERVVGSGFELRAPMAGTFYRAPAPDAEPFVVEGQSVEAGDVVCIIESMKMMNEVKAERSGVCAGVAGENGEAIGSGQVLFRFH